MGSGEMEQLGEERSVGRWLTEWAADDRGGVKVKPPATGDDATLPIAGRMREHIGVPSACGEAGGDGGGCGMVEVQPLGMLL